MRLSETSEKEFPVLFLAFSSGFFFCPIWLSVAWPWEFPKALHNFHCVTVVRSKRAHRAETISEFRQTARKTFSTAVPICCIKALRAFTLSSGSSQPFAFLPRVAEVMISWSGNSLLSFLR